MLGGSEQLGKKWKEGDTHVVTSAPAWVKPPQTSHGTHQYAQHHPSFSARAGNSLNSAPDSLGCPPPSKGRPPSSGSNHDSPGRQCRLWCRFQRDEELSLKANSRIHPDPNDIQKPLVVPHRQSNGCDISREDLPTSFPKVV